MIEKKFLLQEARNGELSVLGTLAYAVDDIGQDTKVKVVDKNKLIRFYEYKPIFIESDFENCYTKERDRFRKLQDLCKKNETFRLFVKDSLNQEKEWHELYSPEFPGWTFSLHSSMVKKYNLKTEDDGSIQLFAKQIEKNQMVQVSPEGFGGTTVSGVKIMSKSDIVESLRGKEFEAINVRICDVKSEFIIVSYQGQTYKVSINDLYFEKSDKNQDMREYKDLLGHDIPMFYYLRSNELTFSEMQIHNTEARIEVVPDDLKVGDKVSGIPVRYKLGLGIFVWLDIKRISLLHVSELAGLKWREMRKVFPLGQTMQFKIKSLDNAKIAIEPLDYEEFAPQIFRKSSWEELLSTTEYGVGEEIEDGQIVDVVIKYVDKSHGNNIYYVSNGKYRGTLLRKSGTHIFWQKVMLIAKLGVSFPAMAHVNNGTYEFNVEEAGQQTLKLYDKNQRTACVKNMQVIGRGENKIILRFGNSIGILKVDDDVFASTEVGQLKEVFLHSVNKDGSLVVLNKKDIIEPKEVIIEKQSTSLVSDSRNSMLEKVRKVDRTLLDGETVVVSILGFHGDVPVFTICGFVGTFAKSELESLDFKIKEGNVVKVAFTGQFQPGNNRLIFHFVELLTERKPVTKEECVAAIQKPVMDTPCKGALCTATVKSNDVVGVVVHVYNQDFVLDYRDLRLNEEIVAIEGIMQILFPKNRQVQLIVTNVDDITHKPSFKLYYPERSLFDIYKVQKVTEKYTIVRGEQGIGIIEKNEGHKKGDWITLVRVGYDENWMPILDDRTELYPSEFIGKVLTTSIMSVHSSDVFLSPVFPYHEMGYKLWMPRQEWTPNESYPVEFNSFQGVPITVKVVGCDDESKILKVSWRACVEDTTSIDMNNIGQLRYVKVSGQDSDGYRLSSGEFEGALPWESCGHLGLNSIEGKNAKNKRKEFIRTGDVIGVLVRDVDILGKKFVASLSDIVPEKWKEWAASINIGDIQSWTIHRVTRKFVFIHNQIQFYALPTYIVNKVNGRYVTHFFEIGQNLKVKIEDVDVESGNLKLSPIALSNGIVQIDTPEVGEIVEASVVEVQSDNQLKLDGNGWIGIVNPGDIVWGILKKGICPYKKGERVRCVVKGKQEETNIILCSIRDILPQPEEEARKDYIYHFIVNKIDKNNIFLTSPNGFSAILPRREDGVGVTVRVGESIPAMVASIDYDRHLLVLTRKPMRYFVNHGGIFNCVVESVTPSSLTIGYKGLQSVLKGSDIADTSLNLSGMYKKGDHVKAMVISYEWEIGKIKLSIRSANIAQTLRKNPVTIGQKIHAKILIVNPDKLIVQWKENYGCINKKDALSQDLLQMDDVYAKGQDVDCIVTSIVGGKDKYFLATTNPDYAAIINKSSLKEGLKYVVTIVRQESDYLVVCYGDMRGSIPNQDLYWGLPYAFDNEKYQVGKELEATCKKIDLQKHNVIFGYNKGDDEVENSHVVSIENNSVVVEYQGTSYQLDCGNNPTWIFLEDEEVCVKPVLNGHAYVLRLQVDISLLPKSGIKVSAGVFMKKNEGLIVMLLDGIKGYVPKEELGWTSAECDINMYNYLQMIEDLAVVGIDKHCPVPCLSRRATLSDPMGGYVVGMEVEMCITQVSGTHIFGTSDSKNAIIEKQHAGWKYQFPFSEDLTAEFMVGDKIRAKVLIIDRDNGLLFLGLESVKPSHEDIARGRFYNVKVVTGNPVGVDRLGKCFLVKWADYYGFMPYLEADYQTQTEELLYRPGEEVSACIYGYDKETGIPFMSHRRMIKWKPLSKENLKIEENDVVKAVVVDSSNLGILIKLKDYDVRYFIDLRYLYSTRQEMQDRPYMKGDEIEVVAKNRTSNKVNFRIPNIVRPPTPSVEIPCVITVLSKARAGYNVFTEEGIMGWLPANEVDFKSMANHITTTIDQKIIVGQQLQALQCPTQIGMSAIFKVANTDVVIARSVSNPDVTDVNNINLEVDGMHIRGCIYQGNPLPYVAKQKIENEIYSKFRTNFGKTEIPDGIKMRVKYQGKAKNGTILVSILEFVQD